MTNEDYDKNDSSGLAKAAGPIQSLEEEESCQDVNSSSELDHSEQISADRNIIVPGGDKGSDSSMVEASPSFEASVSSTNPRVARSGDAAIVKNDSCQARHNRDSLSEKQEEAPSVPLIVNELHEDQDQNPASVDNHEVVVSEESAAQPSSFEEESVAKMNDKVIGQSKEAPLTDGDSHQSDDDEFIWSTALSNQDDGDMDHIVTNTGERHETEELRKHSRDAATTSTSSIVPTPLTPEFDTLHRPRIGAHDIVRAIKIPTKGGIQRQDPVPLCPDASISSWQPTWDASPSGHSDSRQSIGEASAGAMSINRSRSLQHAELELYRRLDAEYEQALEDREVSWKARYTSVRHSALFSSILMILYLVLGCWFYTNHTTWDITDSLLFTVYSVTTVGYGNHMIPKTASFQLFTIWYILVGIALITVLAAHMYQLIVLEATKVHFERDTAELARRSAAATAAMEAEEILDGEINPGNVLQVSIPEDSQHSESTMGRKIEPSMRARFMAQLHAQIIHDRPRAERMVDIFIIVFEKTKKFLKETHSGQVLSVFLPFSGLILFGAIVVGVLEGWTMIESIYWAVVTLTTVGFGDYHPTKKASTWFCIFYLPCSLFFMSFFLAKVAQSYIKLHAVHVQRLEHRMRAQLQRSRDEMMIQQSISSSVRSTSEMEGVQIGVNPSSQHSSEEESNNPHFNKSEDGVTGSDAGDTLSKPKSSHRSRDTSPVRGFLGNRRFRDGSPTKRVERQTVALGFEFLPPNETDSVDENSQWNEGVKNDTSLSFQHDHDPNRRNASRFGGNFISTLDSSNAGKRHREKVWNNSSMSQSAINESRSSTNHHRRSGTSPSRGRNAKSGGGNNTNVYAFKTMKAVLNSMNLSSNNTTKSQHPRNLNSTARSEAGANPDFNLEGDKPPFSRNGGATRPSFALRMLVQQRLAQIIAIEVAGFQSEVTIEENTLKVTIPSLKDTAEKWMLPRRARKAFRSVAFHSLFYVGERDLIIKGADTLLNLSPFEFHGLLSPVLAAMGDGETMEDWLASTDVMADVELTNSGISTQNDRLFKDDEHEII